MVLSLICLLQNDVLSLKSMKCSYVEALIADRLNCALDSVLEVSIGKHDAVSSGQVM